MTPRPTTPAAGTSERIVTWIGDEGDSLFAVLHVPAGGAATDGMILCPSVGLEHSATTHGLRQLAQDLADRGIATLRIDFAGVGHSTGALTERTPQRWVRDVEVAAQYLRGCGVQRIGLVGLRIGALVAAAAAQQVGAHRLVLWDAPESGRRYLREQGAFLRMVAGGLDDADADGEYLGWSVTPEAQADFSALSVDPALLERLGSDVLVAARPGAPGRLAARAAAAGAEVVEAADSESFVSPPEFVPVQPVATIARIVDWCLAGARGAPAPVQPRVRRVATHHLPDGGAVRETLREIGPDRLFTVESRRATPAAAPPDPAEPPSTPPSAEVVFFATANDPCTGPGRMWVELAREFAGAGARCLRFDRRGVGETSPVVAGELATLYAPENREDGRAVDADLTVPADRRMYAGLCSGGWFAADVATGHPGARLAMVSPLTWDLSPTPVDSTALLDRGWDLTTGRAPVAESAPSPRRTLTKTVLRTRMPYVLWRALARRGVVSCPEDLLARIGRSGVDMTMVFPAGDWRVFVLNRGREALERLAGYARRWDVRVLDGGRDDHVLLSPDYRRQTAVAVRELFAGLPGPSPTSEPRTPHLPDDSARALVDTADGVPLP